jgi:uncharacterized membrane protein
MVTIILMAAIAGFFYACQVSVIWGLDAVAPRVAIRAMQGINAEVRNFWFAPTFFGSLVAPIAMLGMAVPPTGRCRNSGRRCTALCDGRLRLDSVVDCPA